MLRNLVELIPIIEIVILFFVFYGLSRFVRGTRGAGLLKGLVILFVMLFIGAQWIARELEMDRISRLLDWFLNFSTLGLLIIFASEIRLGLLRIGQIPFLQQILKTASTEVLDDVVGAAMRMSRIKHGALIAIERDVSLQQYADNGVIIGGALSNHLLETIFYPGSALHDGAVIIRNEQVLAAACLFPLTENPEVSKRLGTRHRAAIGLTEETDAICIIVSEETGRISLSVRGRLSADLDKEGLQKALNDLYAIDDKPSKEAEMSEAEVAALAQGKEMIGEPTSPNEEENLAEAETQAAEAPTEESEEESAKTGDAS